VRQPSNNLYVVVFVNRQGETNAFFSPNKSKAMRLYKKWRRAWKFDRVIFQQIPLPKIKKQKCR
jgi:hypothetical protein